MNVRPGLAAALALAPLLLPPATPGGAPPAPGPGQPPQQQQQVLRGEQVYARCQGCHALVQDRVGPHHCGLLGRRAGSVPGFAYSRAMKDSHITWDEKTLEQFLAAPLKAVPGTTMTYDGVPDAKDRADLIAYLRHANASAACGQEGSGQR